VRSRQSLCRGHHSEGVDTGGGHKGVSGWDGPYSEANEDQNGRSSETPDRAHLNSPSHLAHRTMWRALALVQNGFIRSFGM
jgi:hypothetical protein